MISQKYSEEQANLESQNWGKIGEARTRWIFMINEFLLSIENQRFYWNYFIEDWIFILDLLFKLQ